MTKSSRSMTAAALGAVVGAVAGYLFFTDRGRWLRRQFELACDDITRELNSVRTTADKFSGAANESWKLLNEVLGESGPSVPPRYPRTHQTSPF